MTGGGAPGAAGIIKCLKQQQGFSVMAADANSDAIGKYLADEFVTIPSATDPQFLEAILKICKQQKPDILLPLVTKELIWLAENKKEIESTGTKVLVSDAASLEIANNKSKLYEFLQWRGIAVPAFHIVETVDQFISAVASLGYPQKTVCFKPAIANGSRGFRIISPQIDEIDLLFNHKPNATYISYADAVRILSSAAFPQLLVSEYLPGEEYSVDCLAHHGKAILVLPRIRKKIINGITIEGRFEQNESIISYCTQIIKEINLHGNIGIQVKKDTNGNYLILEINPRVQGTIAAALGAGVNLPLLALKQELGMPIPDLEMQVNWNTGFSRHWTEVFYKESDSKA